MRSSLFAVFAFAFAALGCSAAPTRTVTGQLQDNTFSLDNPVVLAEASDSRVFVAHVMASGRFTLKLPSNVSYRLTLANSTTQKGIYSAVARINWPLEAGAARWATLGDGEMLDLGPVYQRGHKVSTSSSSSASGGSGDCKEDDGAKCSHDGETDCDCGHQYSKGDNCDGDSNSSGDDSNCNKDHGYGGGDGSSHGGKCDGGSSSGSGGGGGSSGSAGGGGTSTGGPGAPCTVSTECTDPLMCIDDVCGPKSPVIS